MVAFCLMVVGLLEAIAGVYYVSPSGSATWAQATNINTPTSVATAFANAVAGDKVYFRGGTYNVPAKNFGDTYRGYYEPKNSGTSANPIVFQAYPGEIPVFNGTAGGSGDTPEYATIFGVYLQSYIVFDGFTFQANNGSKMARVMVGYNDCGTSAPPYNRSNITVQNSIFKGGPAISQTDNREGLRVECVSNMVVKRNLFDGYREGANNHNTSAFKNYHINAMVMENNEFKNNTAAIYLKQHCVDCKIGYNYVHDNYLGIYATNNSGTIIDSKNLKIYHNVFAQNSYISVALEIDHGTVAYFDDGEVYNNTFYQSSTTGDNYGLFYSQGRRVKIFNNIFYGFNRKVRFNDSAYLTLQESNYNQFGNLGSFYISWSVYGAGSATYTSLASWRSAGVQIGGSAPDASSLASSPGFVNSSGSYSSLSDFVLLPGAPSKGTGKGGIDMGALISAVGRTGALKIPTAPFAQ